MAYLISISLVFWLGGGDFDELSPSQWAAKLSKMALLLNPAQVGSAFAGSHAPDVNGSLWTIAYEFRCYVLVAIVVFCLGRATLIFSIMSMSLAIILVSSISQGVYFRYDLGNFEPIGNVDDAVRFTMIFSIGALFQTAQGECEEEQSGSAFVLYPSHRRDVLGTASAPRGVWACLEVIWSCIWRFSTRTAS